MNFRIIALQLKYGVFVACFLWMYVCMFVFVFVYIYTCIQELLCLLKKYGVMMYICVYFHSITTINRSYFIGLAPDVANHTSRETIPRNHAFTLPLTPITWVCTHIYTVHLIEHPSIDLITTYDKINMPN